MSWMWWVAVVFVGIVMLDAAFVCALITVSWIKERKERKR